MKTKNITPEEYGCAAMACPSVYLSQGTKDEIIIIGEKADLNKYGIDEEKIGDDEQAVVVDRKMLERALKK